MAFAKVVKWLAWGVAVFILGGGVAAAHPGANSPSAAGIAAAAPSGQHRQTSAFGIAVTFESGTCGAWPGPAEAALQRAVDNWDAVLQLSGPITIRAYWDALGNGLGSGGPALLLEQGRWVPEALVNQQLGSDRDGLPDINLQMTCMPSQPWNFTEIPAPGGTLDFVTVAMHEIGHGLGMTGNFSPSGTFGAGNTPYLHETFVVRDDGTPLIDLQPADRIAALTSDSVFFSGAHAALSNGGNRPKLHAPPSGASLSHLDHATYQGTENAFMRPATGSETIHDPGPIMRGILKDYGYTLAEPPPTPGTLQFLQASSSASESAGTLAIPVTRAGGTAGRVSVQCQVDSGGTATHPDDYWISTVTVTWEDGESGTKHCIVAIVEDDTHEPDETINLKLGAAKLASIGTPATTIVTILDNDPPILAFTTQPGDGHTGIALGTQPVVAIQDSPGGTLDHLSATISLSVVTDIGPLPPPAISCSANPNATTAGVAAFSGCVITGATGGQELRLRATAPGMATAISEPFTIIDTAYDPTCNGIVDAIDALAVLRALAGFTTGVVPVAPCTGDANDSAALDIGDARAIREFVAQTEK